MKTKKSILCLSLFLAMSLLLGANVEALTWKQAKTQMEGLTAKFNDSRLSEKQKVKFLPDANEILSEVIDMKLNSEEASDRVSVVVRLLGAAIETDFANSTTDTTYFHYKANKKAYQAEIKKLQTEQRKMVEDAFKGWEEFESKANDPAITGKPRSVPLKNTAPKDR